LKEMCSSEMKNEVWYPGVTKKEFPTNEVQNRQLLADRSSQFFFSQKIHRRKIKVDVKLWSKKKETSRNIENLCDTRFCPDKKRPKRRASQTLSCITTREKKITSNNRAGHARIHDVEEQRKISKGLLTPIYAKNAR
jgi:hypothetical protein